MTQPQQADEHVAEPATFDCRTCGRPWPCMPAREQLAEMDVPSLGLYMVDSLYRATVVLVHATPSELHDRFLGWILARP